MLTIEIREKAIKEIERLLYNYKGYPEFNGKSRSLKGKRFKVLNKYVDLYNRRLINKEKIQDHELLNLLLGLKDIRLIEYCDYYGYKYQHLKKVAIGINKIKEEYITNAINLTTEKLKEHKKYRPYDYIRLNFAIAR